MLRPMINTASPLLRRCFVMTLVTVAVVAAATAPSRGQVPLVGNLLAVNLTPPAPTLSVGQQTSFNVTGIFEGGTRLLGGNDGSFWSFILTPNMAVVQCDPNGSAMFGGQNISVTSSGTFNDLWSPSTPVVRATGTLTPTAVEVNLACADPNFNPIDGTMNLTWTGTQYDGNYHFANSGDAELVGLTWSSSNPGVATVNQRGRATAISPGTTIITATYGRTCWPGEPQPPGGCRGTVSGSAVLTVTGTTCSPPTITSQSVSPDVLWPPNHKMVDVRITTTATANCPQQPIRCRLRSITSNEPDNGLGDGDTSPDWEPTGNLTARLRAERSGHGDGRVYTIVTACSNDAGTATHASIVTVPHHR